MSKPLPTEISDARLQSALKESSPEAGAAVLLSEESHIRAGMTVVVIGDAGGYAVPGSKGKVKGLSNKGSGFVDLELENGTTVPAISSMLWPVG